MDRDRLMRLKEVSGVVGLSRSTIYALMAKDLFPQRVLLGQRSVAWWQSEVDEWVASRPKIMAHSDDHVPNGNNPRAQ